MRKDKEVVYNAYTKEELENYKELHNNMNFSNKIEVEKQYNLSQIIILSISWIFLIILSIIGTLFNLFSIFLYFHGFFLLFIFSIVLLIYSIKRLKITNWYLFTLVLSIIQIIVSLCNMFTNLY